MCKARSIDITSTVRSVLFHGISLRSHGLPSPLAFSEDISPEIVPTSVFPLVCAFFVFATGYDCYVSENSHFHVVQRDGVECLVLRFQIC
jgi:hypothetical protein